MPSVHLFHPVVGVPSPMPLIGTNNLHYDLAHSAHTLYMYVKFCECSNKWRRLFIHYYDRIRGPTY